MRLTSEDLKRLQSGLEKRMSEDSATNACKRRFVGTREEAVELIVSEDNQNRLRLGSRLDEILIPYRKYTELDFSVPEEMAAHKWTMVFSK